MADSGKKHNHQVTRSLLSRWQARRDNRSGIWYFDIRKQKSDFSQGVRAAFAIVKYLYAPVLEDGLRDDSLENEFSQNESAFALLLTAASNDKPANLSLTVVKRAIQTCISLGYRSAYFANLMMEVVDGADAVKMHRDAIVQMRRSLTLKYAQFKCWRFTVYRNLDADLLISEQPFRDWTMHSNPSDVVMMALGPRALLVGVPSADGNFSLRWVEGRDVRVNVGEYNSFTTEMARQFVVAKTEVQLRALESSLSRERVAERAARDRLIRARYTWFSTDDSLARSLDVPHA